MPHHHREAPQTFGQSRLSSKLAAKLVVLALSVLASLALAGCGGDDEGEIAETIQRFYTAASRGDGKEACRQLTPAARSPVSGLQCEFSINQLGQLSGGAAKRRLAAVEVRDVRVQGRRATARVQIPTQTPATLQLEKIRERTFKWKSSDEWKLASLGTAPGGTF